MTWSHIGARVIEVLAETLTYLSNAARQAPCDRKSDLTAVIFNAILGHHNDGES